MRDMSYIIIQLQRFFLNHALSISFWADCETAKSSNRSSKKVVEFKKHALGCLFRYEVFVMT